MNASDAVTEATLMARDALRVWGLSSSSTAPDTLILEAMALEAALAVADCDDAAISAPYNAARDFAAQHAHAIWTVAVLLLHQADEMIACLKRQDLDGALCNAIDLGSTKMTLAALNDEGTAQVMMDQLDSFSSRLDKHLKGRNSNWIELACDIWAKEPSLSDYAVAKRVAAAVDYEGDESVVRKAISAYRPGSFLNKHFGRSRLH